ncbi:TonB-dependent receptor [Aurantiacibacter flavus]|uniref:TonB-dependent receptor n=1 Tax=Aurantiacibacter flavus TaxID=3145232 RepID=A0ABV0D3G0_9SPHN
MPSCANTSSRFSRKATKLAKLGDYSLITNNMLKLWELLKPRAIPLLHSCSASAASLRRAQSMKPAKQRDQNPALWRQRGGITMLSFSMNSAVRLLGAASVLAVAVAAQPTLAQDGDDATATSGDEIIVTAQFREQRLQDTPIAITALDSAAMDARSMTDVTDIAAAAPNLMLRPGGSAFGPAATVYIRGVGQYDSSYAFEPGVGMYIDDVYHGSLFGSVFDLLDLERIEVLRGPQGTLAGKNSIGGAVKLYSKQPSGSGRGFIEVGTGSFNRVDVRGAADVTLVPDELFLRVAGVSKNRDGYVERYDFGCLYPDSGVPSGGAANTDCKLGTEGGVSSHAGRATLYWTPTPTFDVSLSGMIVVENNEVPATKLIRSTLPGIAVPASFDQSRFITGPGSYINYATYSTNAYSDPARYDGQPGAGDHAAFIAEPVSETRAKEVALTMNLELGDGVSLTSITAYQDYSGRFARDIDLSPFGVNTVMDQWSHEQFTQELRVNASLFDDVVDVTAGAFFYDSDSTFDGTQYNLPGTVAENLFINDDLIQNRSYSGFLHAVFHATDRLNITTGLRYTDDEKTYLFGRKNPFVPSQPTFTRAGALDGVLGEYEGDRIDYRVNVDYRWSDALMTYAQVSTGYKGGGINPRPFVSEQATPFDSETLTAFEAGLKSDLFDRALRLNASIFLNKYKDIILSDRTPTPNSTRNATPVNAGDADIKGVEFEATARPVDGLLIDASISYLDFQFTQLGVAGAMIDGVTLDSKAPNTPEWKWSVGTQYELMLGNAGSITPRFDISYQSSFFVNVNNSLTGLVDAYTTANARMTWRSPDEEWEAALAVTNLFDNFYYLNKFDYPLGTTVGQPVAPREWRVSVKRRF